MVQHGINIKEICKAYPKEYARSLSACVLPLVGFYNWQIIYIYIYVLFIRSVHLVIVIKLTVYIKANTISLRKYKFV